MSGDSPSADHPAAGHAGADLVAQRRPALLRLSALLAGVALLVLGNGLAGTLVPVRAALEGMRTESIGLMMSAYSAGFVLGSLRAPHLIRVVGHIRTFAALASMASAIALSYPILVSFPAWLVLRTVHGACYAGLIVVIESWLNGSTTRRHRGRVLAVYNVVLLGALVLAQPLLTLSAPTGFVLFCVVSICLSLALVPITLMRAGVPGVAEADRAGLRRLWRTSPLGLWGALTAGLLGGALFGMGPVVAQRFGLGEGGIALFMGAMILGGLVLQWPLGYLSDLIDRRLVILAAAASGAVLGLAVQWPAGLRLEPLLALVFLFGGAAIPLYPLCVAHVNDHIEARDLVPAASSLVMVYGAGSALGPFAAGLVIARAGGEGLFLFGGVTLAAFVVFALYRTLRPGRREAVEKREFVAVPRTSHAALQMHEQRQGPQPGERAPP